MEMNALLEWWGYLRAILAWMGLIAAFVAAILVWRVRGLLSWKRSQRHELVDLKKLFDSAEGVRKQALGEIITACEAIGRSSSLGFDRIHALPGYWRRIAACYYPEEAQPELCLSIGRLLAAAQQLADRLDNLLQRPGFDRLGRLRVRQLRRTFLWYQQFTGQPVVAWIIGKRQSLRTFRHFLRFVFPDPLAWIAYLSQRLTVMMAVRCLLIDVYLYTGNSAVDAFDAQNESATAAYGGSTSNAVLEAYEAALENESRPMPAELAAIRNKLIGLPGRLLKPPGIREWYQAVENAAHTIAASYFPASPAPLDEATCRVLFDRGRYWLEEMAAARRLPVVRPLYRISLKRLYQVKTLSESDLLHLTGKVAEGAWSIWRWTRWPIKALRWIRSRSPAGVAVDVGIALALKSMQNFLARYGFDRACQELDVVFQLSGKAGQNFDPQSFDQTYEKSTDI